jgi:acyl-CoA synthetase (AMP-forming)/AMP-acid ligase II
VANAAVLSVPDVDKTEEIVALVVLRDGEAVAPHHLYAHCQAHLAKFKWPRYFVFRTAFPLTSSGKVAKHEIKKATPNLIEGAFDAQTSTWLPVQQKS